MIASFTAWRIIPVVNKAVILTTFSIWDDLGILIQLGGFVSPTKFMEDDGMISPGIFLVTLW